MKHKSNGAPENPTVHYARLELAGEGYDLAFDFAAIAKAEKICGLKLLLPWTLTDLGVNDLQCVLFSAMLKAQPKITLEKVSELMQAELDAQGYVNFVPKVWEALRAARAGSNPPADPHRPAVQEAAVLDEPATARQ